MLCVCVCVCVYHFLSAVVVIVLFTVCLEIHSAQSFQKLGCCFCCLSARLLWVVKKKLGAHLLAEGEGGGGEGAVEPDEVDGLGPMLVIVLFLIAFKDFLIS